MNNNIIIPDKLATQVLKYSTKNKKYDSVIDALQEWLALKESEEFARLKERTPEFLPGFEIIVRKNKPQ
jgi:hypothetical protein